jgi:hypothetical protein
VRPIRRRFSIDFGEADVRYGSKADISQRSVNVRFTLKADMRLVTNVTTEILRPAFRAIFSLKSLKD